MLASTIQFTNTPRPPKHPPPRRHPPPTRADARPALPPPPRQQPPPPHTPPDPHTGEEERDTPERGLFPQDPTARRHPHPTHARAPVHQDRAADPRVRRGLSVMFPPMSSPPPRIRWCNGPGRPATPLQGPGGEMLLRKEVIQPHLPVRLPCYDFVPIASPTFDHSLPYGLGRGLRVLPTFVT